MRPLIAIDRHPPTIMRKPRLPRLPQPADLPALTAFVRGYLHEDVLAEHGSALDAATAFARDASPEERHQLVDELERIASALDASPAPRVARFFTHDLRAAWTPATVDDLRALITRIRAVDSR
jgi:hypothetical protein